MELEGNFPSEYLFDNFLYIRENLRLILIGGHFQEQVREECKNDYERWAKQKVQNRKTYIEARKIVDEYIRKNPAQTRAGSEFSDFRDANFEETAIDKIKMSINSKTPKEVLIKYWQKNRDRCSYFNKFSEGWLFTAWYFMGIEQEPKKYLNVYEDIEHLIFLNSVDGIVSNETRFMRIACRKLFPKKDFLSVDELIGRINSK